MVGLGPPAGYALDTDDTYVPPNALSPSPAKLRASSFASVSLSSETLILGKSPVDRKSEALHGTGAMTQALPETMPTAEAQPTMNRPMDEEKPMDLSNPEPNTTDGVDLAPHASTQVSCMHMVCMAGLFVAHACMI